MKKTNMIIRKEINKKGGKEMFKRSNSTIASTIKTLEVCSLNKSIRLNTMGT